MSAAPSTARPWLLGAALIGLTALGAGYLAMGGVSTAPPSAPASVAALPPFVLYYGDAQGMYLVPVSGAPEPAAEPVAWARRVFSRLQVPPTAALAPAVAPGAQLRDAAYAGARWTLTVSLPEAPGSTAERMLVGALVRTYAGGWPGAKEVQLHLVDAAGKPLASQHLDLSVPLTAADVTNEAGESAVAKGLKSTMWWPSKDGGSLVPVQLELAGKSGVPPRDAFERLLAGPPAEAGAFLAPVVPPAAKPSWAGLDAGEATIEVAGELPGDDRGRRFVEATVLTLTEFPDVQAVRFTHGGRPLDRTVGPFRLSGPIARPAAPNGAASAATR